MNTLICNIWFASFIFILIMAIVSKGLFKSISLILILGLCIYLMAMFIYEKDWFKLFIIDLVTLGYAFSLSKHLNQKK